ncbi:hypothetical protein ACX1C1_10755 [Paenibacillus sp. strain BS8-2]
MNVYTSYKTIIPVEHLDKVSNDARYHLYCILSTTRTFFDVQSLQIDADGIECRIKQIIDNKEVYYKSEKFVLLNGIDHTLISYNHKYPYDKIDFSIPSDLLDEYYEKHKDFIGVSKEEMKDFLSHPFDAQFILNNYLQKHGIPQEMEVLYVGKAYGKNGNRLAQDRLSSHSTLQKILTDYYSNHQDKRIYILLLEMEPILNTFMDGISEEFEKSEQESEAHLQNVLQNPPIYEQVINITEAAIINFFKPHYNEKFIDNFPLDSHQSYRQYYDLDYNALTVEIDMEFNYSPQMILMSEHNKITCVWDSIEFNLFNDPNRKSMYDIFN